MVFIHFSINCDNAIYTLVIRCSCQLQTVQYTIVCLIRITYIECANGAKHILFAYIHIRKQEKPGNVETQDMLFCIPKMIVAIVGEINEKLLGLARIWSVLRIPYTKKKFV